MMTKALPQSLPQIPEKRYFTIGEVSELCSLKPYVLRYWEQEFRQLKPLKRSGSNRRSYQRKDIVLVRRIMSLLYQEGYTIEGARAQLEVISKSAENYGASQSKAKLRKAIAQLEAVLKMLQA